MLRELIMSTISKSGFHTFIAEERLLIIDDAAKDTIHYVDVSSAEDGYLGQLYVVLFI